MVKVHFIGIGGAGMGAIAEVMHDLGNIVSGSDLQNNYLTDRLQKKGIKIFIGHDQKNIDNPELVVITSALSDDNLEWQQAIKLGIPVVRRAAMLAEIIKSYYGIAVAGTHGKTTTASLLVSILLATKTPPNFAIGGKVKQLDSHANVSNSKYFIVEADESDGSFKYFTPQIAIATNIDQDHMVNYANDFNNLKIAFKNFLSSVKSDGLVVLNADDAELINLSEQVTVNQLTYGFNQLADIQIVDYQTNNLISNFVIKQDGFTDLPIKLNLPGKHNASNAAAAIAVARWEKIAEQHIIQGLANFVGIDRRFQYRDVKLDNKSVTLVDDYGHHPKEIKATLQTAKECWQDRRIVLVYQPHRFTRTKELFNDFVQVLSLADQLILLPIYHASEQPIEGVSSNCLKQAVEKEKNYLNKVLLVEQLTKLPLILTEISKNKDVILLQGAGSIGEIYHFFK